MSTDTTLAVTLLNPGKLFRVSGFIDGEPHFGATGGNRFDAPGCIRGRPEYRSCYLGLHGALLKRMAGHADLAGTTDYSLTQSWALAVFNNPLVFDGFVYMSRHQNTGKAAMLFDRAAPRLTAVTPLPLLCVKGFAAAARAFGIVPA